MKNLLSKAAKWIVSVLMVLVMFPTAVTTVKAEEQSANLNDFVKNVTIAGVNENNGSYTVFPDQEYSIDLQFGENSNKQFANKMTYIFPTGFNGLFINKCGYINHRMC